MEAKENKKIAHLPQIDVLGLSPAKVNPSHKQDTIGGPESQGKREI